MTDIEVLRLVAPEFVSVSDETVSTWIELTKPMVSKKQFRKLYHQALALLTAHRMKMSGNYDDIGEAEDSVSIGSIGDTFRVASYHEGDASITFRSGATSSNSGDSELELTNYGNQYLNLRHMAIVPIHCSGEVGG